MGAGTTDQSAKTIKLSRCNICRKLPTPQCAWRQGRCPHRDPASDLATIKNFLNFFKRQK
jgi:hypothetical protein